MNATIQKGFLMAGALVGPVVFLVAAVLISIPLIALGITFLLWSPSHDSARTKYVVRYDRRKMPLM
jgi:hypothetical protein